MKEDKTEFNILLVSDIHNQKDQLEKIVSKCYYFYRRPCNTITRRKR